MNSRKAKQIRKLVNNDPIKIMIQVRNHCGSRTEKMGGPALYRTCKKLYKAGKLKLT
jgi:hypothetical protein